MIFVIVFVASSFKYPPILDNSRAGSAPVMMMMMMMMIVLIVIVVVLAVMIIVLPNADDSNIFSIVETDLTLTPCSSSPITFGTIIVIIIMTNAISSVTILMALV